MGRAGDHLGRAFDLDLVLAALEAGGLIDPVQAADLRRREAVLRAGVLRDKDRVGLRAGTPAYQVTPVEVVAAAGLRASSGADLDEDRVVEALAAHVGVPYTKIDATRLDQRWIPQVLSRPFARKHVALPLERDGDTIRVAVANPFDFELFETLRNLTRAEVVPVLAAKGDILRLIAEIYGFRRSIQSAAREASVGVDIGNLEQFVQLTAVEEIEATDRHVINALDYLLHHALDQRASDLHLEPKRDQGLVRLRIDGMLHDTHRIPKVVHPALITRIKTLARLDIAEKRRPQDGRFKVEHGGREVEVRVSTMATAFGEKIVLRLMDRATLLVDLEGLGFTPEDLETFRRLLAEPSGIAVVCGPTGAGKTTTLYSALSHVTRPEVNVVTIEDPIEMVIDAFNQTAVHARIDLTFSSLLRTVLRQDPDVILLGEVRDPETARQAVQAALTGHKVLTSLHTRDAAGAVARLIDLGIEPFLLASTLTGVVAQRLVRVICERCRAEVGLDAAAREALGIPAGRGDELRVFEGQGCTHCRDTGYRGRTGVFEVLTITDTIRALVRQRADATSLRRAARQDGMTSLREAAVRKLAEGVTSLEEVLRVTSDAEDR